MTGRSESQGDASVLPILMAAVQAYLDQEESDTHGPRRLNAWKRAALRPFGRASDLPSYGWKQTG